ncbi:MAG TPA: metallophosphoesterase [Gemmatimonadaceae bacterium]|nr:metallophosphoesterase [Gemmatimonadaceae bacterium]
MRIFHVSDLHFGRPAVPEQIDAIEEMIQRERYEVVAISGDVSQRARAGEFLRARSFIRDAQRVSRTIIVPGNHDVRWWHAPLGVGDRSKIYEGYRTYIAADLEPVLHVPGATFVGLNTCHGITRKTLTWNLRDLSIIGYLTKSQIERARAEFARSPRDDVRIIVMHHNPLKGELSQRHGLKNTRRVLGAFADLEVDAVLCGHDHQEAIHYVEHTRRGTVVSTAGTVSNRSRGGRPSSLNVLNVDQSKVEVTTHVWSMEAKAFLPGAVKCFTR